MKDVMDLPVMGLGVGVWKTQARELLALRNAEPGSQVTSPPDFDFFEIYDSALDVSELQEPVPMVLHASRLSPLGADPVPAELLEQTRRAASQLKSPWVLEDIAVWRIGAREAHGAPFWPGVYDQVSLAHLSGRLEAIETCLGRPFLCEFPPLDVVLGDLPPHAFFSALTRRTSTRLVLDVSHWLRYCQMLGAEPVALLDQFPVERVVELHVSGGTRTTGPLWYEEEHSADLLPECLELLDIMAARTPAARAITVECHAASVATILRSLASVAQLPSVKTLRAARALAMPAQPSPGDRTNDEGAVLAAAESLARRGPALLHERERSVRRWLEDPRVSECWAATGRYRSELDQELFATVPEAHIKEAVDRTCRRLFDDQVLVRAVLGHVYGDLASVVRSWFRAQPDDDPTPTLEEILTWVIEQQSPPAWARDCLRFHLDSELVRAGASPTGVWRPGPSPSSFVVCYGTPVLRTLKALARSAALPLEATTELLLSVTDEGVVAQEIKPSAQRFRASEASQLP